MKKKIAIITDTDSSLSPELAAQYQVRQVPIAIHFGNETFETWEDIDDQHLFERIDKEGVIPKTSAPSPGMFVEAYKEAFDNGADEILCFTVSSGVSATYNSAMTAIEQFPDREITVIDTKSLTMGQGFMVLEAAQMRDKDATREEILAAAEAIRDRTHLFFALPTLKYLAMSGRVGQLTAGMATILNIKPILTVRDGKLDMLERVRTKRKSWARVVELCEQTLDGGEIEQMAMIHVNAPNEARELEALIRDKMLCPETSYLLDLTPGLSVHGGNGLAGIAFVVQ
ncbi:MAG: DegV family protein [Anaerolineales bacterium]|nr:DegV family protein [Anaerolineales bacterium]